MRIYLLWIWCIALTGIGCAQQPSQHDWQQLFDGRSFKGWTLYLGVPEPQSMVANIERDGQGRYTKDLGINNDPLGVYTIIEEDGEPAIKVTGEVFGTLITEKEYSNYHVKLQFKWGEKKWPPRLHMPRDAGLLYHGFGEPGSVSQRWHPTQECQIQEGDTGDYWPIGDVTIDIPSAKTDTAKWWAYKPSAPLHRYFFSKEMSERRCIKYPDNERPHGQWNTVEVIALGDSSIHLVNGKVVMRLYHSRSIKDGVSVPLTSGKIALQSEGAEVFYRRVEIRAITTMPKEFQ